MQTKLAQHQRSLRDTLKRFSVSRWSSGLTVLALGIGLAIPALLYSLSNTFGNWLDHWDGRPQMSLFLQQDTPAAAINEIRKQAGVMELVAETAFISAEQGLKDFRQTTELDSALDLLQENPLPDVVVVYLKQNPSQAQITQLSSQFKAIDSIETVQYDLAWLQRLSAINRFIQRSIALLASLLAAGVILLISNTIRLEINTRQQEIEIIDQLGASKAFIRRPFLYFGALEGLFGGLAGLLITLLGRLLLQQPINDITALYAGGSSQIGITPLLLMVLIVGGTALGWMAARITVWRHLQLLRPE